MEEPSSIVIADTSVLINFLAVDRMDLIKRHSCRFLITEHVRYEITDHYDEQLNRLKNALEHGILKEIIVDNPEEVRLFTELIKLERFGYGECASIAVAMHRSCTLAIDDRKAIKQARLLSPSLCIVTTEDLMISMIKSQAITIEEANALKDEWASFYKFKLKINSFEELMDQ